MPTKKISCEETNGTSVFKENLNDMQKHAYRIAQEHLETSFSIEKSNGYQKWKKEREEAQHK